MPVAAGTALREGGRLGVAALAMAASLAAPAAAWPRRPCVDCDVPFQWDDPEDAPPAADNPPLPQGFVLTYRIKHGQAAGPANPLNRYAEVGAALAACWASSATTEDWRDVTLRFSFRRDGSINGVPRVQHIEAPGDAPALEKLKTSFLSTLDHCTPLRFSSSLGQAIAGQIFAIRFIQAKDNDHG
jgi:hypothetical protein